ncbi:unnamed protein product [Rhizoctonia solani]|uniref:F-box domain-containing protein n=2 Tax=Rhizoctonia solani TaxID=456999 RepID=A0A8H3BHG5_9AGAM|nr:unnamed protein product [Rhizoctonia solani]
MSILLCLPEEIMLHVLVLLGPSDVRSCRMLCRSLNNLVAGSPRLLFSLALDSLGYTHPSVPRPDLAPFESLKLLKDHYHNWLHPNNIKPTKYGLRARSTSSKYVGGVYAQSMGASSFLGTNSVISGLEFYQVPSRNSGTEFKHWHLDMNQRVHDYIFDPDQDLLILLELPNATTQYSATCTVHLRTMGENKVHPRALAPIMTADFTNNGGFEGSVPNWSYHFEIIGELLGILFRSRSRELASWVIIWDWVRGIEVTRTPSVGGWHSSFILLDQRTLLLPRSNDPRYVGNLTKSSTFGSIEVLRFDPKTNTSTPPRVVSTFCLPTSNQKYVRSTLKIRCAPNVRPMDRSRGAPKAYEPSSEYPLVAIDVNLSQFQGTAQINESAGILYVPTSAFLHSERYSKDSSRLQNIIKKFYTISVLEVPWYKWAHHTSWVATGNTQSDDGCFMYGCRVGTLSNRVGMMDPANQIHLLDFNRRRSKKVQLGPPKILDVNVETGYLSSVFNNGNLFVEAKYTETILEVEDGVDTFDKVILDDEHVMVVRNEPGLEPSLSVYAF